MSSVTFSADGQTLASGAYDDTVLLWNVQTGEVIRELKGHKGWMSSVAFSADGQTLASGAYDDTVKLWDLHTAQQVAPWSNFDDARKKSRRVIAGETFQTRNWIKAAFWLAIGIVFLSANNLKKFE